MAAMAAGGILLSLLAPLVSFIPSPAHRLRTAFAACAVAALLSILQLNLLAAVAVSFFIGAALGLLTVTLVTHLSAFAGNRNLILKVGLGTGIGYFLCNVPAFFTATPQTQPIVPAALCLLAIALAPPPHPTPS